MSPRPRRRRSIGRPAGRRQSNRPCRSGPAPLSNSCRPRRSCSTAPACGAKRSSISRRAPRFLGGDIVVFGRRARGERFASGFLREVWELRRDGELVWGDALHLEDDVGRIIDDPACFDGAAAFATMILSPPAGDARSLLELRPCRAIRRRDDGIARRSDGGLRPRYCPVARCGRGRVAPRLCRSRLPFPIGGVGIAAAPAAGLARLMLQGRR